MHPFVWNAASGLQLEFATRLSGRGPLCGLPEFAQTGGDDRRAMGATRRPANRLLHLGRRLWRQSSRHCPRIA